MLWNDNRAWQKRSVFRVFPWFLMWIYAEILQRKNPTRHALLAIKACSYFKRRMLLCQKRCFSRPFSVNWNLTKRKRKRDCGDFMIYGCSFVPDFHSHDADDIFQMILLSRQKMPTEIPCPIISTHTAFVVSMCYPVLSLPCLSAISRPCPPCRGSSLWLSAFARHIC